MPVAEATDVEVAEANHYEFAFHVLPTVAEGEVSAVFDSIKAEITKAGGELTNEEAPKRIELAYEIVRSVDGKNRKFGSAYFGWTHFKLAADALGELTQELEAKNEILRSLMIKLTRVEEENPFFYHEALADQSQVTTIEETPVAEVEAAPKAEETEAETEEKTEEAPAEEATEEAKSE